MCLIGRRTVTTPFPRHGCFLGSGDGLGLMFLGMAGLSSTDFWRLSHLKSTQALAPLVAYCRSASNADLAAQRYFSRYLCMGWYRGGPSFHPFIGQYCEGRGHRVPRVTNIIDWGCIATTHVGLVRRSHQITIASTGS